MSAGGFSLCVSFLPNLPKSKFRLEVGVGCSLIWEEIYSFVPFSLLNVQSCERHNLDIINKCLACFAVKMS